MTRKLKLLIVEDEAIVAMMLEDMALELGHEVAATAGRMAPAMDFARTLDLDLAILDVNLNGEHTYPLATMLSARGIPFVFATGYGLEGLSEEWRGATVLRKPFQIEDLDRAIAAVTAETQRG